MIKKSFLLLGLLALTACAEVDNDNDELQTVPVTNNPQLIPGSSGGLPGIPTNAPQ